MATRPFKVVITGGGPVGLIAAHALSLASIDFVVLEQRDTISIDVGASLVLSPPSLRVLHQMGLLHSLLAVGGEIQRNKSFTVGGEFKNSTAIRLIRKNHGIAPVAFHRAELVQLIYDGLPQSSKDKVLTGKKVTHIESTDDDVRVMCADGSEYRGSIVIGADGVHSRTRRLMRELALRSEPGLDWDAETPYTASYRCLWCSFPRPSEPGENFETQHSDRSVMYITGANRGWMFLYEKLPSPTSQRVDYSDKDIDACAARFAEFPITESLKVKDVFAQRTTAGMSNLEEGLVKHWCWGRIVLVGDACHKFTPNAGLGLNNGIQDVVFLCNELYRTFGPVDNPKITAIADIFCKYQKARVEALQGDASRSAHMTRTHAWANPIYHIIGRLILKPSVVDRILLDHLGSKAIRKGLVLDYVECEEVLNGAVSWEHPMPSATGKVR